MANAPKLFAIASETSGFNEKLTKSFSNFNRDSYHFKACGNLWLFKGAGWTLEKIRSAIEDASEDDGAFIVLEVKDGVSGFYYKSLWDWLSLEEADE